MLADAVGRLVAASPLPRSEQGPGVSKAKAHQILSQPQFKAARPNVIEQVLRWIADHLGGGAGSVLHGGADAAVAWVILLAFVAVVVLVVRRATRGMSRDPERDEPGARVEIRRTAVEWRTEAESLEARGEWKEALLCRYRGLVAELVARRVVRDLPGRTTGEYRAEVTGSLPEASREFAGASELFERAWYGDRPTGADESARFEELAGEVVTTARRRGRGDGDGEGDDADGTAVGSEREMVAP